MKTGDVLIMAGLGLVIYFFAQLGTAANTVQILFSGIQPVGLLKYRLNFTIQNVSNAKVTLHSLTAAVTVNGNDLGNVSTFTPVDIQPNSATQLNVDFVPSILSLPGTIIDLLKNSGGNLDFEVTGNANIDGLVLPINQDTQIAV